VSRDGTFGTRPGPRISGTMGRLALFNAHTEPSIGSLGLGAIPDGSRAGCGPLRTLGIGTYGRLQPHPFDIFRQLADEVPWNPFAPPR
jgi:hypothetical protein